MKLRLIALEDRLAPAVSLGVNGTVFYQAPPSFDGVAQSYGFEPFPGFRGPLSVAAVDSRFVFVGAGEGGGPRVQAWKWTGSGYDKVFDELAFEPSFRGGVKVASADWDGDGTYDLIVGAGKGGGPRVRVFSGLDFSNSFDEFAFEPTFRGGVDVEGNFRTVVMAPGEGGGPRVRVFFEGQLRQDAFVLPPDHRGVLDYAFGVSMGLPRLFVLDGPTTLRTFDSNLRPVSVATLYHPFSAIGIGDYFNFEDTSLSASDQGHVVTLDENFGLPLGDAFYPLPVQVGTVEIPPGAFGPPPPVPPVFPLLSAPGAVSSYQASTGDSTLFSGRSIGSPFGTLTYTLTATDGESGRTVGLSNYHGFNGLVPVVTPGRADAVESERFPVGTVLRLDRLKDADWAVFSVDVPTDRNTRISYFDGFEAVWKERVLPPMVYDPNVKAVEGEYGYRIGRTSAFQRAVVRYESKGVLVGYPDGDVFQDRQTIYHGFGFSKPGDSGSPVFHVRDGVLYLTGQLFAGDGQSSTIVTDISRVFAQADVSY